MSEFTGTWKSSALFKGELYTDELVIEADDMEVTGYIFQTIPDPLNPGSFNQLKHGVQGHLVNDSVISITIQQKYTEVEGYLMIEKVDADFFLFPVDDELKPIEGENLWRFKKVNN